MKSNKKQKLLKSWTEKNHINAFLFDFDDTLIGTTQVFRHYVNEALDLICSIHSDIDRKFLDTRLHEINNEAFLKWAVNPRRWNLVINSLAKEFSQIDKTTVNKSMRVIRKIYTTTPDLLEGAEETLDIFSKAKIKLILVTHANEKWTEFKLDTTGLRKYFSNVVIANEDKHKTPEVWLDAIKQNNVLPGEVAVVGDNLKGDIISAFTVGVQHLFWVDTGTGWKLYREGEVPKGTKIITGINKLIQVLNSDL